MAHPLRREIQKSLPNIQDGLIAAVIFALAAGFLAFLASKIAGHFGLKLEDLLSNVIGCAIFGVILFTILLISWKARKPITKALFAPKPTGDRIVIYVTCFKNDKKSRTLQDRIEATIQADFGDTLQVRRAELSRFPLHSESSESEAAEVAANARSLLAKTTADLAIWGKLIEVGEGAAAIHFVSPNDDIASEKAFSFREGKLLLEAEFSAELGAALAALAHIHSEFASDNAERDNIVDVLSKIARRFNPLVDHLPPCIRPYDAGLLLRRCAYINTVIGYQSAENAPLDLPLQQFQSALAYFPKDSFRYEWAEVKSWMAQSMKQLGQRRQSVDQLEQAAAAVNAALEIPEYAKNYSAPSQRDLAQIFGCLEDITGDSTLRWQAIAALLRALHLINPNEAPLEWAQAQVELGSNYCHLAQREQGMEHLDLARLAFDQALTKLTKENARQTWANTQVGLAWALSISGERMNDPQKVRDAINALRALAVELQPFPLHWTRAQIALGNALRALSKFEEPEENLKQEVAAYELALATELSPERDAADWAAAQYDCGGALLELGELQTDTMAFNRAEIALRQALKIYTSGPRHDNAIHSLALVLRRIKERQSGLS